MSYNLIFHGIQNDQSDYRIHIGFASGIAYVFPTANARTALNPRRHKSFTASQPGVGGKTTGAGYFVPWQDIPNCKEVHIPGEILARHPCKRDDLPQVKGKAAVAVTIDMLRSGLVALPALARDIEEKDIQIRGIDLIVTSRLTIQCKCDWSCAQRGLAIQTAECNPLHRY